MHRKLCHLRLSYYYRASDRHFDLVAESAQASPGITRLLCYNTLQGSQLSTYSCMHQVSPDKLAFAFALWWLLGWRIELRPCIRDPPDIYMPCSCAGAVCSWIWTPGSCRSGIGSRCRREQMTTVESNIGRSRPLDVLPSSEATAELTISRQHACAWQIEPKSGCELYRQIAQDTTGGVNWTAPTASLCHAHSVGHCCATRTMARQRRCFRWCHSGAQRKSEAAMLPRVASGACECSSSPDFCRCRSLPPYPWQ